MDISTILNDDLDKIIKDGLKYREQKIKHNQYISTYITQKRADKDPKFIELYKQCNKTYYEKNKEVINKKRMDKYYKKKAEKEALKQTLVEIK
jgi:hypothetical protein